MKIYCRLHGRELGVVEMSAGGFEQVMYREPRIRDHHLAAAQVQGRYNGFRNIGHSAWGDRPTVDVRGCRYCGIREVSVKDLRAAFAAGLPYIYA